MEDKNIEDFNDKLNFNLDFLGEDSNNKSTVENTDDIESLTNDRNLNNQINAKDINTDIYEKYNNNPFVSKGRISRFMYFVYMLSFTLLCDFLGIDFFVSNKNAIIQYLAFFITILTIFPQIFVLKKRIFDITLKNKLSWFLTIFLFFTFICSFLFNALILGGILNIIITFTPKKEVHINLWRKITCPKNL